MKKELNCGRVRQLLAKMSKSEDRLEDPPPVAHPRLAPLGQQLLGQRGEGPRPDPELGVCRRTISVLLLAVSRVDVAGRLPRHRQVESLEIQQSGG